MQATYNCGCPPPAKKEPCSPCCGRVEPPSPLDWSKNPCRCKPCPESGVHQPKAEEPPLCCPTMPSGDSEDFARPRELRSEIAEKGLPYKELEVSFNNNKLVIRTQREPVKPEFDPPCDCVEDPQPAQQDSQETYQDLAPGCRTVTLYPRPKQSSSEMSPQDDSFQDETCDQVERVEKDENPNLFLFRMKKRGNHGDKAFNIDLEFKTPKPWSEKKRMEHVEWNQLDQAWKSSTKCSTDSMVKKVEKTGDRVRKKGKKKKKKKKMKK